MEDIQGRRVLMLESRVAAEETSLNNGLVYERRLFQSLFATKDQKEGESSSLSHLLSNWHQIH